MFLILNKRLSIPVLTILFLLLILSVNHLQTATPAYAFVVDDWDQVVGSRGLDVRRTNMSFHLVSVPTGTRIRRHYGVDEWVEDVIPSPSKQIGIFQGADSAFPRSRKMIQLWDGGVRTFAFDQQLREPNVWSPDSAYLTVGIDNTCRCDRNNFIVDLAVVAANTGDLRVLTNGEFIAQDFRSVVWSPDGRALVYVNQQLDPSQPYVDTVKLIPMSGGQPARTLFTHTGAATPGLWLRWLPDGQHIAVTSRSAPPEIWFVDVQSAQITFHYMGTEYFETCWSPKTDHFIVVSPTSLTLITPDGSLPLDTSFVDPSIWKQNTPLYDACLWSPDGSKLVLIQANAIAHIIDFDKRSVSEISVNPPARFLIPYWSPDSRMLALKTYRPILDSGDTYIYDITTMQQVLYQPHTNFLMWLPELS